MQSLSEEGVKLIELLEDKSTSRNIVATIFEEQAKILLKEIPKPEKQTKYTMKSLILAQDER